MPGPLGARRTESTLVLRSVFRVSPQLASWIILLGVVSGLILPALMLVSGYLVTAVAKDRPAVTLASLLVALFLGERLLDPLQEETGQALWRRIDESLAQRITLAVQRLPSLADVESTHIQNLLVRATGTLTESTPGQGGYFLGRIIAGYSQGAGCLVVVALYRWWLAILLIVSYRAAFVVYRRHWHGITKIVFGNSAAFRHAYYCSRLATDGSAAQETRIFGLDNWLIKTYRESWVRAAASIWRARDEAWGKSWIVVLGLAAVEAFTLALVALQASRGEITGGTAIALAQAILGCSVLAQYNESQWHLYQFSQAVAQVDDLEREAPVREPATDKAPPVSKLPHGTVRFQSVSFAYPGAAEPILSDLDLEIEGGKSLAIVGENGAGKTTLVKLLCRLYQPDGGRITVEGLDVGQINTRAWHRRLAVVFQDFTRFDLSLYDNVTYGALHNRSDRRGVEEAIRLAGAGPLLERLSRGLETLLTPEMTGGTELSFGEWQRIALARALFAVRSGAELLILDEPTAALDIRGEAEIYDRFLELTKGTTTVLISHRFSTVRRAHRIVVVEAGTVKEQGTHDQLMMVGGRYAEMYLLQSRRFRLPDSADA
jgi:ATP-binding cassette subfamily B protein